jgi:hypothetical protein
MNIILNGITTYDLRGRIIKRNNLGTIMPIVKKYSSSCENKPAHVKTTPTSSCKKRKSLSVNRIDSGHDKSRLGEINNG